MKKIRNRWLAAGILFALLFALGFAMSELVRTELGYGNQKLSLLLGGGIALLIALSSLRRKKREYTDIEQGSAHWESTKAIKPFFNKDFHENIILAQNARLSIDMYQTHRNCHVCVIGGSGSGKTRFYIQPNILQMNASYVIVDTDGSQLAETGKMLQDNGYKVKVFNTVNLKGGMRFNPFVYFQETRDIKRFINILMSNTSGDSAHMNEDFWAKSERLWLMAHIAYVMETCAPEERSMTSVMLLLNASEAREDDETFESPVDFLFYELAKKNPESFAVKQYVKYKLAAGKTAKSILVSIGVRLADLDIPEIADMFSSDELELDKLGTEKTALFLEISDMDTTYTYLVAILLDVLFNVCEHVALQQPGKHLPIMVRCLLDEIANIGRFPNLHIVTGVIRKYWVSLEFMWQNVNQIKALYKDNWATIEGNCDTTLFLGGKGEDTTKYVSNSLLGKATIDTVSYGSSGSSGSFGMNGYNRNEQKAGRSLLDETEVARLKNDECIISIRGLNPIKAKKYDPATHPNYKQLGSVNPHHLYTFQRPSNDARKGQLAYITEIQEVV